MKQTPETRLFKPTLTEAKSEATAKTAREMAENEAAARTAKTERLRAARLARGEMPTAAAPKKSDRKR